MKNDEMHKGNINGMTPEELKAADFASLCECRRLKNEIESITKELHELEEKLCMASKERMHIAHTAKDDRTVRAAEIQVKQLAAFERLRVIGEWLSCNEDARDCLNSLSPDDDRELLENMACRILRRLPGMIDESRKYLEWRKECEAWIFRTDEHKKGATALWQIYEV